MLPASLATLREQLSAVVAPPPAAGDVVATGLAALDGALPNGGIPCGRLTELVGSFGGGKTTVIRAVVTSALQQGRWVAYIDGTRTLAPRDWAPLADTARLWVVRPPQDDRSAWCADILLRSGAFGLVVLDSGCPVSRAIAVRLTRLARESNAAFVVLRDDTSRPLTGGALRLRVERQRPAEAASSREPGRWRSVGTRLALAAASGSPRRLPSPASRPERATSRYAFTVLLTIEKGSGGHPHVVEVHSVTDLPRRLRTDPEVPDRRGVAKRNRRGELAAPDAPGVRRAAQAPARSGSSSTRGAPPNVRDASGSRGASAAGASGDRGGAGLTPAGSTLPRKRRCAEPDVRRDAFLLAPLGRGSHCGGGGSARARGDGGGRAREDPRRHDRERSALAVRRPAGPAVG